ncbi:M4 family peptidase [Micromonospora sp. 15K316]|uniref:M4 family metallopeptidase n=1 Tax=Micromonospora sp. 15K316 TaxID=2530376 RepID=UPI00104A8637|nr:M4 family metallopeptidase [Micromonospora sp. 15K316]TDC33747.1 M4 family peptidase [Micromonospora sp. 15K316]
MRRVKAPPALAILAAAALLGTTAQAANAAPASTTTDAEASVPVTVAPATDTPALVDDLAEPVDATIAADKAAKAHLTGHKDRYRIADPAGTLTTAGVDTRGERETVRLNQKYKGLPVFGGQYVVRMEKKAGKRAVTGTSGSYFTDLDVDTTRPTMPADVAIARAVEDVRKSLHPGAAVVAGAPRPGTANCAARADLTGTDQGLVVMPTGSGVLARRVLVKGKDVATGQPVLRDVYVGATNGVTLLSVSRIKSFATAQQAAALAAGGTAVAPRTVPAPSASGSGTTSVVGEGKSLHGATVPVPLVRTDDADSYLMIDQTHTLPDGRTVPITTWDARGRDYYDLLDGQLPEGVGPFASPSSTLGTDLTDAGAVDAAWDAAQVFEWFQTKLGRNSLDDNGMAINSIVGITYGGSPWVNAYWDGTRMVYGSGDDEYLPLAADPDVVGHEMTHGVVENSASLVYAGQPGALNEAIADYFGNAIDLDAAGTPMTDPEASLIGGDLCRTLAPTKCALRDLDDGATTADFQHLMDTPQMDDGGVHLNSTIVSGALWDLRQAFGGPVADKIVYRALTDYLTPMSDFVDAREAVLASAKSSGLSNKDLKVVRAAFDSRGITAKWKANLYGKKTDLLVDRLNTGMYVDMTASMAGGWFAVPRADANRTEPTSIWVGRTDGKVAPYRISPNDGNPHSFPHTDGKRVVWLSIEADQNSPTWETDRILSAPIGGGHVEELYRSPYRINGLGFDGTVVTWSQYDPEQGYRDVVRYLQGRSRTVHTLAHPDWVGNATAPSVKNGKISYVRYEDYAQPDANGNRWSLGVEVYDLATGKTTFAGGDPGAETMSYPQVSGTGVAWVINRDYGRLVDGQWNQGTFNDSVRLFDFATRTSHLLFEENSPQAIRADVLTLSDTTLTVTEEAPYDLWLSTGGYPDNALNPKLKQYTFDGEYVGPASCSPGAQMFATAGAGREVIFMDSSAGGFGLAYAKGAKSCE